MRPVAATDRAVGGAEKSASTTTPMMKIVTIASQTPTKGDLVPEACKS